MPDDADWAADMAERERQALIARHLRRQPPPAPPTSKPPPHLSRVMDDPREAP
jgi:hypothetical protein